MKILSNFTVEVNDREIYRYLGYKKNSKIDSRYLNLIVELKKLSKFLTRPISIYSIVSADTIPRHRVFKKAEMVAFSICSIGPALEEKVSKFTHFGEVTKALILDAIGSCVVEEVADYANFQICTCAKNLNLLASRRFSPGYSSWKIEGQQLIFKVLDGTKIGVKLLSSMMMVPRKSISFAVNLSKDISSSEVKIKCSRCNFKNCPYRHTSE